MRFNIPLVFAITSPLVLSAADRPAAVHAFLTAHCVDCHGADVRELGLRLDRLEFDLDDRTLERTWIKVLDKVVAGEMPPPDAAPLAKRDVAKFTGELRQHLHDASLARQRRDGRVVLRRLNRNEYQNTLRDLLGNHVDVKEMLPEDGTAAGFDKVAAALDVSGVHLLKYQEAAETAIRSVIPSREPEPFDQRHTGRTITERVRTFSGALGKTVRLDGDTLLLHVRTYDSVPCASPRVNARGRYRVTASVRAVGTGGRSLPVKISCSGYEGCSDTGVRVRDVPPGRTVRITEEFEMDSRQIIVFNGWDLPSSREFTKILGDRPLDEYEGPGLAVDWIEITGPIEGFPSPGYRRLFGDVPLARRVAWNANSLACAPEHPREDAERLIRNLLPIVFRRPVSEPLAAYFVGLAHTQLDRGEPFEEAMVLAYTAMFCSPHFLYLTEPLDQTAPGERTRLDDYAIASRLSYFLWSSLPDETLFDLARRGRLRERDVLRGQVERMLDDPRSERFVEDFTGQWLDLRNIDATTPDPRVYGEFDDFLFWSMPRETRAFFAEVLENDRPVPEFVDSDWTFLNQRLAQHYGIPGVVGGELRKVRLPADSHRGGVLTQAAIMKVTADGSRTSPVLRGAWVLERILGHESPPPPADVPEFEPDVRGATTIRQQLDKHRSIASCAVCHAHIDPPGFALESFDAIGGYREFYRGTGRATDELPNYPGRRVARGPNVESGGRTADGRPFDGIDEYRRILRSDEDALVRNVVGRLVVYATGADVQFADREVVDRLVADAVAEDRGLRTLLHDVVQSRVFLNK